MICRLLCKIRIEVLYIIIALCLVYLATSCSFIYISPQWVTKALGLSRHRPGRNLKNSRYNKIDHFTQTLPHTWLLNIKEFRTTIVIALQSETRKSWDRLFVVGQALLSQSEQEMKCCLLYKDSSVREVSIESSGTTGKLGKCHFDRFFVCPRGNRAMPAGIAMVEESAQCPDDKLVYVKPYIPPPVADESFVLIPKHSYGNLDPELVIEWMETHRYLEVDKVVSLIEKDIHPKTLKVFEYYGDMGFLDYMPSDQPFLDPCTGEYAIVEKGTITASFGESYRGYKYMAIWDMDEFLVPSNNMTLKQLMRDLVEDRPDASGFRFQTAFHMTSWDKTGTGDLLISQYRNRTLQPIYQAPKSMIRPDRLRTGTLHTHYYSSTENYTRQNVFSEHGFLHHYRACRPNSTLHPEKDERNTDLCYTVSRTADVAMETVARAIRENVLRARKAIFGSTDVPKIPI